MPSIANVLNLLRECAPDSATLPYAVSMVSTLQGANVPRIPSPVPLATFTLLTNPDGILKTKAPIAVPC